MRARVGIPVASCLVVLVAVALVPACGGDSSGNDLPDVVDAIDATDVVEDGTAVDIHPDVEADGDCDVFECAASCPHSGGPPYGYCDPERGCLCTHTDGCTSEMGGLCNAVLQCGCASGERCVLSPVGVEECEPQGTDPVGTPCGPSENCVSQSQCFGHSSEDLRCRQFCYEDTDCPDADICVDEIVGVTGYRLCAPDPDPCDVFTGAGCAEGEGCYLTPPRDHTDCTTAGTAGPGDSCGYGLEACRVGARCQSTDGGAATVCRAYCDLTAIDHPCPADFVCSSIGHPTIGVCLPE